MSTQPEIKLPPFEDSTVQAIYQVLCDQDASPPKGEHWEGFVSRRIAAVLADRAARAETWQPIATAPKDGTDIFVYVRGDTLYPTAASYKSSAYFEQEYGDSEYMAEGWYWSFGYPSDFHEEILFPTHWMPLPAPPTQERGADDE